ncbi:hypothetical protein [Geodermatophilus sp. DSM 44513]|uniref:hypothetical protein n=1 Tax=Geodermatophilus sp. DSM 44513 TaxID=1528104 RepID=UPI001411D3D7|nr:hypothetical protein [Geodermatophilus sp. DSM 44513]WNV77164.1 hypothetical protein RTG05_07785 [Geodermatophilus sp. DSM 44513]
MDTARRWGIGLTAVAVLLWLVFVIAVVTTAPEDGANIGAGLLFLLAIPCTVAGATLLITTRRGGHLPVSGQQDPALSPAGAMAVPATSAGTWSNQAALWALVVGIVGVVLVLTPIGATEVAYWTGVAAAVVICLVAVVLGWLGLRRARARGGVRWHLALAGVVLGATGLGWNLFRIPELILFVIGDL